MRHTELAIIKGVAKIPGDTKSAEQGLTVLNLLSADGFSVQEGGWIPQLAAGKGSDIYAETSLADGRSLVAGANGNVTETITLNASGASWEARYWLVSKLIKMRADARAFSTSLVQIEPVYLKWWGPGAPGPQYALITNIEVAGQVDPFVPINVDVLTITVERETYWRALPPGANPKQWTIENALSQDWSTSNSNLLTGTNHIVSQTIQNRAELNSGVSGYTTQNFVDIPAASIPGDAPALVHISVQQAVSTNATALLISKMTKSTTGNLSRSTNNNQIPVYNFNAADGSVFGADTTLAADTGSLLPYTGGATRYRSVTTFATTATMSNRLVFFSSSVAPNGFSTAIMRGRYNVFLRARVSAAANVSLQLSVRQGSGNDVLTTTPVILTDLGAGGTGNTTDWALVYLGSIGIPVGASKTSVAPEGNGIFIDPAGVSELEVAIQAARNSGAGSLYMADMIFLPIDEGAISIKSALPVGTGAAVLWNWAYDNTGYLNHGTTEENASIQLWTVAAAYGITGDIPEFGGLPIYLTPGVNNRLYFLTYVDSTLRSTPSDPSAMAVRVNIVPRWVGIRDV